MRVRPALTGAVLAGTACLLAAAPASGATTCFFEGGGGFLGVSMDAGGDHAFLQVGAGGEIEVIDKDFDPVTCSLGTPFVGTAETVGIEDSSGRSTGVTVSDPLAFIDAGNEIEFDVDLGSGKGDELTLAGGSGSVVWRYGTLGININVLAGADLDYTMTGVERNTARASSGGSTIAGIGSQGTGDPFSRRLEFVGSFGDDIAHGGDGRDLFQTSPGADVFRGFEGRDTLDYCCVLSGGEVLPIKVTVGKGANDGAGEVDESDTTPGLFDFVGADVERVLGTLADDTLIGDGAANILDGGIGRDRLKGRGGKDTIKARDLVRDKRLDCGPGNDRIRFDSFDPSPISC
jgi:Ca2+-binding RTX toxin-like protein